MDKARIVIVGAAGRDFHNFNMMFRDNPDFEVVAFTAAQIPGIDDRIYPAGLAGDLYPAGVPILPEEELESIIAERDVDSVLLSYSDLSHEEVMHLASRANAAGADFWFVSGRSTMIVSDKPVISVCAVRTGCGKSQTSRKVAALLSEKGLKVGIVRHPMPYGDLILQRVQRFASVDDFKKHSCTIEEIEEYEHYVDRGMVVYAGVDYEAVIALAESENDVIVWDGGNNDTPFVAPNLSLVVLDPLRPGHEMKYFPGEINLRSADVLVVNKVDSATQGDLDDVLLNVALANPLAPVILADSRISVDDPVAVEGKRVLVVEDGPTLTHGGMSYGAGTVAASKFKAAKIIDPRPFATGSLAEAFKKYPHMGDILPALGYYEKQLTELEESINQADCDTVLFGTPIDLRRYLRLEKPAVRVTYELDERPGQTTLSELLEPFTAQS
jgi:predicted GTPase